MQSSPLRRRGNASPRGRSSMAPDVGQWITSALELPLSGRRVSNGGRLRRGLSAVASCPRIAFIRTLSGVALRGSTLTGSRRLQRRNAHFRPGRAECTEAQRAPGSSVVALVASWSRKAPVACSPISGRSRWGRSEPASSVLMATPRVPGVVAQGTGRNASPRVPSPLGGASDTVQATSSAS